MRRLFSAFANLWRGLVSGLIGDLAEANPVATYEGIIQKRMEQHDRILKSAGACRGTYNNLKRQLEVLEHEEKDNERQILTATRTKNKAALAVLVQKRDNLAKQLADIRPQVATAQKESEEAVLDVGRSQREIRELQSRMDRNIRRLRNAEQVAQMQRLRSGLSTEGDEQMLKRLEDSIEAKVGAVEVQREIDGQDIDRQLEKVRAQTATVTADAEAERLIAEFEAKQAGVAVSATPTAAPGDDGKSV